MMAKAGLHFGGASPADKLIKKKKRVSKAPIALTI